MNNRPGEATSAIRKAILWAAALFVVLHAAGAAAGIHVTWGFHHFGFLHPGIGLAVLLAGAAVFIPAVHRALAAALEWLAGQFRTAPPAVIILAILAVLVPLCFIFAPRLHLLGDGAILMRSIPISSWGDEVNVSFKNQPLLNVLYKWAMSFQPVGRPVDPRAVYVIIDLIGALLFAALLVWLARLIARPSAERFLLAALLFFGMGSQFFFGYVENYVLQYVGTAAYALAGWAAIQGRINWSVPLLILALLPGFNLGSLILMPSALVLILWRFRENRWKAAGLLAVIAAAGLGLVVVSGANLGAFFTKFTSRNVDFLQLFSASDGNFPYPMFSLTHLLDWFNAAILIFPFGLFVTALLIASLPKADRWSDPVLVFLLALTACGLAFTWIVNAALGMARDWDMLASFFVPLMVLTVYLLSKSPAIEPRRPVLVIMTALSFLHWAGFILLNADARAHLARVKTLGDKTLLSKATQMTFDEALANYFYGIDNYPEARIYYEDYMRIDSSNTRILGNISDVYRYMGDKDNYLRILERAVTLESRNPGIYSNLGVEYAARGDTGRAIEFNEKAVGLDSSHPTANANLGVLYLGRKEYRKALVHFDRALRRMRDRRLFLLAAEAAINAEQYPLGLKYYNGYLERAPADTNVRAKRDRLAQYLGQPK